MSNESKKESTSQKKLTIGERFKRAAKKHGVPIKEHDFGVIIRMPIEMPK